MKTNFYQCKPLGFLILFMSISWASFSQTSSVSGKVTDDKGETIVGASIAVKGTSRGTNSDVNGRYKLDVPSNATLIFSFVGFDTQEIVVGNRSVIDVAFDSKTNQLQDVVVIGYGTQRKSDLTGSVGSVKSDQLLERPVPSLNQGLSGRIAGVQVNNNSGRPGGRTTIRVRGFSSINSSNNPLYVVDGVMLP